MSKKSLGLMVVVSMAVFMVGLALSDFVPQASGQQVLPGGRPAKIHSFYGHGASTFELTDAVPGDHGFIITDVVTATGQPDVKFVELHQGSTVKLRLLSRGAGGIEPSCSFHFESGVRLEPGEPLIVQPIGSYEHFVTVTGYAF